MTRIRRRPDPQATLAANTVSNHDDDELAWDDHELEVPEDETSWRDEVGDPYRAMVAAAVAEPVLAAAFCYPAEFWVQGPVGTLLRRGIRRVRGRRRWDDRLPSMLRQSVVALTTGSLMVFEYRVSRRENAFGPQLGRWRRDEIAIETRRMVLKSSTFSYGSDSYSTDRMNVLRLTATTPDGLLMLDLPIAASPGIRDFEHAIGTRSSAPAVIER